MTDFTEAILEYCKTHRYCSYKLVSGGNLNDYNTKTMRLKEKKAFHYQIRRVLYRMVNLGIIEKYNQNTFRVIDSERIQTITPDQIRATPYLKERKK